MSGHVAEARRSARWWAVSSIGATILLMGWSMVSQLLPWGVPTVAQFSAVEGEPYVFMSPQLVAAPSGQFTTARFDEVFAGSIATLATDRTFSWIVSVPREAYRPARYFAGELATQFLVALGLTAIAVMMRAASRSRHLQLVATIAVLAGVATYGTQVNWWGMPATFAAGMVANLVAGWLVASWWLGRRVSSATVAEARI